MSTCLLRSCGSRRGEEGGVDGYIVSYSVTLYNSGGGEERKLTVTWKSRDEGKELLRARCLSGVDRVAMRKFVLVLLRF